MDTSSARLTIWRSRLRPITSISPPPITRSAIRVTEQFLWGVYPSVGIDSPGDRTNYAGFEIDLPLNFSNPLDQEILIVAAGLPAGLSIDSEGVIAGTIAGSAASDTPVPRHRDDHECHGRLLGSNLVPMDGAAATIARRSECQFARRNSRTHGNSRSVGQPVSAGPDGDHLRFTAQLADLSLLCFSRQLVGIRRRDHEPGAVRRPLCIPRSTILTT